MSQITPTEKKKLRDLFRMINPANFAPGGSCIAMGDKDFPHQHLQTPEQIRNRYKVWFESWLEEDIEFLKTNLGI